jgi:GTPase
VNDDVTKSGFVSIVGRPNAGKSTLLNNFVGSKVSIVSNKAQTTRTQVRGVLTRDGAQVVFVDTPGIGRPKTALGERLNESAYEAFAGVDVVVFVVDATKPVGKGDLMIAEKLPKDAIVVLNKCDRATPAEIAEQLTELSKLELSEYFPVSARKGDGTDALLNEIISRLEDGPAFYEMGVISDTPEETWIAELVREQLLAVTEDELPHSIAAKVTEWEWPRVRVEILVERDSQKGIVIGAGGATLKEVGTRVRQQMESGVFLELFVKVDKNWQRRQDRLDHLGY